MITQIDEYIRPLIGQPCCRKRVGHGRSLSLGFGKKVYHGKPQLLDPFYGEWELGSYSSAWRIVQSGKIVCASHDAVDSADELSTRMSRISMGPFRSLLQFTEFDVRIELDGGFQVDFLGAISDDDELFHLFGPSALYIEFSAMNHWKIGKSNRPWPENGSR